MSVSRDVSTTDMSIPKRGLVDENGIVQDVGYSFNFRRDECKTTNGGKYSLTLQDKSGAAYVDGVKVGCVPL